MKHRLVLGISLLAGPAVSRVVHQPAPSLKDTTNHFPTLEIHKLQTNSTQLPINDSFTKAGTDPEQGDPENDNKRDDWLTEAERENICYNAPCQG